MIDHPSLYRTTHVAVSPSPPLRQLALDAADYLKGAKGVIGIALLGSVARGDTTESSDVDLLVICAQTIGRGRLQSSLPRRFRKRVSLLCTTPEDLNRQLDQGLYFIEHVRREGETLYDPRGVLKRFFDAPFSPDIGRELRSLVRRLRLYDRLEPFDTYHLFPLAHLYGIGKRVVILGTASAGTPHFNKKHAFAALQAFDSTLTQDLQVISELSPFYRVVGERPHQGLPFSYVNADEKVRNARAAILRVAAWVARREGLTL
jgi:predicted nucleotidyltransferase